MTPGLNLITGPISTGKTTLLRLCRSLLGARIAPNRFIPEVREHVKFIAGNVTVHDTDYSILRPFLSTDTARIDIATNRQTWRLPYARPGEGSSQTYLDWLLETLNLPRLRVPTAPTRPDSDTTPLTINDYMMYCNLTQSEIDSSVFGHSDPFRNIKRKFVFEVLYGKYDIEVAELHEQLRSVRSQLWRLDAQTSAFEQFLEGTHWQNRASLMQELAAAREALQEVNRETHRLADQAPDSPLIRELRSTIHETDRTILARQQQIKLEESAISELTQLANQLDAQVGRLTRSLVAESHLVDFEFLFCPRCGSPLNRDHVHEDICILCLQHPTTERPDREVLINEQNRLGAQLLETEQLIAMHQDAIDHIRQDIANLEAQRTEAGGELNFLLEAYVSDSASALTAAASKRAELSAQVHRLEDYLTLYERFDRALGDRQQLEKERSELEAELDTLNVRTNEFEEKVQFLEAEFQAVINELHLPEFGHATKVTIDRSTYLPVLNGRTFGELSSQGLHVLINVAHAVAHQRASLALQLGLPQILLIDGLTSNLGHENEDADRISALYRYLVDMSDELGSDIQVIVADNYVPQGSDAFIRLQLADSERLITAASGG